MKMSLMVVMVVMVMLMVVVVTNFCKKCNYENKMAGKGQITNERASS